MTLTLAEIKKELSRPWECHCTCEKTRWLAAEVERLQKITDSCVAHIADDQLYQHIPLKVARELTELREKVALYEALLDMHREAALA